MATHTPTDGWNPHSKVPSKENSNCHMVNSLAMLRKMLVFRHHRTPDSTASRPSSTHSQTKAKP